MKNMKSNNNNNKRMSYIHTYILHITEMKFYRKYYREILIALVGINGFILFVIL